ncbi:protease inhibitor [Ophiostoma piceae UAMH 11346]|uniref:Protease inhibitor n=1 Tax=Ophiostoma piceae (strain UAMH 11346) TaxID=1262450 RepID=S3CFU2_OPHP1|nr:protease inhibitor [Ophiostoma piceae UAMH 11346]
MDRFAPVKEALAALEQGAAPTLKLEFPSTAVVDVAGKHLTPAEATGEPALYVKSSAIKHGCKYVCLALDPDAPFPSFPFLGPVLHGVQTDLAPREPDQDDRHSSSEWSQLVSDKAPLVAHAKPGPPRVSAPHRYVSVLWRQPDVDVAEALRRKLGWGDEPIGLTARIRFDVNVVVEALGLEDVVAISYFTSSS